jgi:hypothetical protein
MSRMNVTPPPLRSGQPWFYRWPALSVAVAAALYVGIFVLRMTTGTPAEATMLFFVLPISLIALAFGMWWGLAGGMIAFGLIVVWAVSEHVELSAVGWATRALPMLLLGVLVGRAADRLRASEAARATLDAAAPPPAPEYPCPVRDVLPFERDQSLWAAS